MKEMLEGMVQARNDLLLVPSQRVVVHREYERLKQQQVTLVSGGGSGHEPTHAGYIGEGMLTAVACGDVFASPSTQQVLTAIRLVAGPAGCLVLVKNYTGDRINFGLAVEQAKAEGLNVEMVIIGDDVAVHSESKAGRRGLCGTVLMHKIAGAAARSGKGLKDIVHLINEIIDTQAIATMGVALTPCTLPGQDSSHELGAKEMELGMGIHGEPGVKKCEIEPSKHIVKTILTRLTSPEHKGLTLSSGDQVVLVVNNLGATTPMELYVVVNDALEYLSEHKVTVERVLVGSYMTALNMAGCSLTLWKPKDEELLTLFDSDTSAPGWTYKSSTLVSKAEKYLEPEFHESTTNFHRPETLFEPHQYLEKIITHACQQLIEAEPQLTAWDMKVGDGDCGNTFKVASEAVLKDLKSKYPLHSVADTLRAIAESVKGSAGGTSGVLYNILFTSAANKMQQYDKEADISAMPAKAWYESFAEAVRAVQKYGGAAEGSRTMMDALIPAERKASELMREPGHKGQDILKAVVEAATAGAESTKNIPTNVAFGRSAYISNDVSKGIPDPGAMAVSIWMKAIADSA